MHYFQDESLKRGFRKMNALPLARVDPFQRCAAVLVYGAHFAILPLRRVAHSLRFVLLNWARIKLLEIFQFLEGIPIEDIESKNSSGLKLQVYFVCSTRNRSRNRDIVENTYKLI